ncbi:MAG: DUF3524 domain-containing protein, partial [Candidatus Lindowbacteria bacterium]|nr:DUF3524 domain-containing protein [Candidatus Lindowbacteria bacterium]
MKVLFLEPFHAGSHKLFLEGYIRHSSHQIKSITMPGRAWKWRLRGSAISIRDELNKLRDEFDILFASSLFPLADAVGLCPWLASIPRVVYMHENEAAYPVPKGKHRESEFALTQLNSILSADKVLFNSKFNLDSFLLGIREIMDEMPDSQHGDIEGDVRSRSVISGLGIDFEELDSCAQPKDENSVPIIVWNHRWEFDKNPEEFYEVLVKLKDSNVEFRLAVLGGPANFEPKLFTQMKSTFENEIIHFGHIEDRKEYLKQLWQCHVAVSTSRQDFFGISMVEAAWCGLDVVLPNRLAYPEVLGSVGR